ncbi:MAG: hypothetical protein KatS3mg103_1001 [Phycisphaerales bacterium]|nr:MAG: hypothetical protein KatS3mg103_1001 [Phycisphaerales bacterium]
MTTVRADLVTAYVLREPGPAPGGQAASQAGDLVGDRAAVQGVGQGALQAFELLQLRRLHPPARGTWQPVMGHVEAGETAVQAAVRELGEEVGLRPGSRAWRGFWQLEEVHPYFVAELDAVVLGPSFAVLVAQGWEPDLDAEPAPPARLGAGDSPACASHDAHRWVAGWQAAGAFLWPGQRRSVAEALELLATRGSALERALRLAPPARGDR